jgi:phosphatidate cytidylyltransferase
MGNAGSPSPAGAAPAGRSTLKQRLLTVAALLPLLLAFIFLLPNAVWALVTCIPIALAAMEWGGLAGYGRPGRWAFTALVLGTGVVLALWRTVFHDTAEPAFLVACLNIGSMIFWTVAVPLWLHYKWRNVGALLMAACGWIVLVPAWIAIVTLQRSPGILFAVLLLVWIADTAAYFAGRRFGRRKLAPLISPGKTWEGVIGAYAAVIVYSILAGFFLQSSGGFDRAGLIIFFAVLAGLSILGDLFESWIKRQAGAKDSGTLLPGHGGMLDRIDSLTSTLPFAALYFLPSGMWR